MGQWYVIPSTCDVALDFQTKIEGQWNVMPRACGRRNVALYIYGTLLSSHGLCLRAVELASLLNI